MSDPTAGISRFQSAARGATRNISYIVLDALSPKRLSLGVKPFKRQRPIKHIMQIRDRKEGETDSLAIAKALTGSGRGAVGRGPLQLLGMIRLWNRETGELLGTRATFENGAWIFFTPDGRFDASDGASRFCRWVEETDSGLKASPLDSKKDRRVPNLITEVTR